MMSDNLSGRMISVYRTVGAKSPARIAENIGASHLNLRSSRRKPGSGPALGRSEPMESTLQLPGNLDTGEIAILRADDLNANRQARFREARRSYGGWKVGDRDECAPKRLVDRGN